MARSLRARLLAWVLLPLAATVAVQARIGYLGAEETATLMQDRLLLGSARTIAEDLRFEDGVFQAEIPPAAIELFQSGGVDRIYYRVTSPRDELLIGYADLPHTFPSTAGETPVFSVTTMRGEPVRRVVLAQPVVTPGGTVALEVEVAQTLRGHRQMLHRLWLRNVGPLLAILALASVLIVYGLHRGLQPATRLHGLMRAREPGTLEPLAVDEVPRELVPLVDALNGYIDRLDRHARSQRAFIENAAHQLRTPLTVLNAQVASAMRSTDPQARDESLAAIRQTVSHAARMVTQLLTLSVADAAGSQDGEQDGAEPVDLAELARHALEDAAVAAQGRHIDLGFEQQGESRPMRTHPLMVREMLANLLDNAIRYTPPGGVVTLRVRHLADAHELEIEDNGPGIAPEWRERVFERFFRIDNGDSGGAGLGLPIVRQFAQITGAAVSLQAAPVQGLRVILRWPAAPA